MSRIDDIEARSEADPSDKALADLVAFVREMQDEFAYLWSDKPRYGAVIPNERRLRAAFDRLNGETE